MLKKINMILTKLESIEERIASLEKSKSTLQCSENNHFAELRDSLPIKDDASFLQFELELQNEEYFNKTVSINDYFLCRLRHFCHQFILIKFCLACTTTALLIILNHFLLSSH